MQDNSALRLYERSLAGQWNADKDVDWTLSTAVATPEIDSARKRLINELYWSERQSLWTVERMNIPILRYFDDHQFALCAAAHTFDGRATPTCSSATARRSTGSASARCCGGSSPGSPT